MWVRIERLIAPDGGMITHVQGVKGAACEKVMEALREPGDVVEQAGYTAEFYEREKEAVREAARNPEAP